MKYSFGGLLKSLTSFSSLASSDKNLIKRLQTTAEAEQLTASKLKSWNRCSSILPYDSTRVKLITEDKGIVAIVPITSLFFNLLIPAYCLNSIISQWKM